MSVALPTDSRQQMVENVRTEWIALINARNLDVTEKRWAMQQVDLWYIDERNDMEQIAEIKRVANYLDALAQATAANA